MKNDLQPLGDNVILQPISEEETTKSGIVLPDTAEKEKPEKAKVIAIGPGKTLESGKKSEMTVKEGNTVLFKKYGPDEIKIDDEEYLIASMDDILAIVK
ncbi:MAG: co-chaperone GroES [Parcubacteria group bacterium]|nr:co-chaperone GroES [Parcubacteria group bacterium]